MVVVWIGYFPSAFGIVPCRRCASGIEISMLAWHLFRLSVDFTLMGRFKTGCFAPGTNRNDLSTEVLLSFRPLAEKTSHLLCGWSLTL
jgi:hypothetical protein